jgi:hypothetical protein
LQKIVNKKLKKLSKNYPASKKLYKLLGLIKF